MKFESDKDGEETKGTVFKLVASLRAKDAELLLKHGRGSGSLYLAGYSIECHLKYIICKRMEFNYLPTRVQFDEGDRWHKLYTHQWDTLVEAGDFREIIRRSVEIDKIYSSLAAMWGPELRYRTEDLSRRRCSNTVRELLDFYQFLREIEQ